MSTTSPPVSSAASDRWSAQRIGELVGTYRRQRNMKVSQLARQIGVTPSLVSQIERGNSRPSVATLFALAEALDVSVDVFAAREPGTSGSSTAPPEVAEQYVVHRGNRRSIAISGGVTWEMLTPGRRQDVEFLELVYEPHAESNESLYRHPGFEMMCVLAGRFDIYVGFDVFTLGEGDSIAFPSSMPHRYVNPTDGKSHAITVILHEGGDDGPTHPER